ncbi:G-protein coupled receptor 20-like, partial [Diretmus argenteus]
SSLLYIFSMSSHLYIFSMSSLLYIFSSLDIPLVIRPIQPMENLLTNFSSISTQTRDPTNCSAWDQQWGAPYLHRLAHLDVQLYQDFYAVWVSLMVCNCLMLVVGVVLNTLALYVFCGTSTHPSAPVVYTMNLAVADLLVALSLPARIALYHSGGSCLACSYVHTFSYFVNMYCSILFLT